MGVYMKSKDNKSRNSNNYRFRMEEIPVPPEVMEKLISENGSLKHETQEEEEYREKKEDYNKKIINKIKTIELTKKQKLVIKFIFTDKLTLKEAALKLGIAFQNVDKIKNRAIKKIRKNIKYEFL